MSLRKKHGAVLLGLILLTTLALGHVCRNDFITMDDPHYVTVNKRVTEGLSWSSLQWSFTTFHVGYWMPLTWLSLQLDASLYWPNWGGMGSEASEAAWGFHLTNLLWHLANTVLVYWFAFRLTGSIGASAVTAALFGVHPLRVESVAWITERKDVLSTFFGLLALLSYLGWVEKPGWRRYARVSTWMMLALMAKPMLVTLPLVMLLLDGWPLGRTKQVGLVRLLREKALFFGLSLLFTGITIFAQRQVGAVQGLEKLPVGVRVANAVVSYERYLAKTFWPTDLACFYPHPGMELTARQVVRASILLAAITGLAVAGCRLVPAFLVGWLWFLLTLTPVIGFIQAGEQGMADRFTYFPLLGLFLALAVGLDFLVHNWPRLGPVIYGLAAIAIGLLAWRTWEQVRLWENSRTLYQHTLAVTEDNAFVYGLLGIYLFDQKDWVGAEYHLHKSLAIAPANKTEVHLYYGVVLYQKGQWQQAAEHLQRSLEVRSDWEIGHYYLGQVWLRLGQLDPVLAKKARESLTLAFNLDPNFTEAYLPLGIALAREGRWSEAAQVWHRGLAKNPGNHTLRGYLAQAFYEHKELNRARREYGILQGQGWTQSTAEGFWEKVLGPDPAKVDPASALELATQLCQASGWSNPRWLDLLAVAQAALDQFDKAQETVRQALAVASEPELVGLLEEHLILFAENQKVTVRP